MVWKFWGTSRLTFSLPDVKAKYTLVREKCVCVPLGGLLRSVETLAEHYNMFTHYPPPSQQTFL